MILNRDFLASVSMGNKLFVIGGYHALSSEVFDSLSRKFSLLNLPRRNIYYTFTQAVSIGFNIVVFSMEKNETRVYIYDLSIIIVMI